MLQFMGMEVLFSTLEINIEVFVIRGNEMLQDHFCKKRFATKSYTKQTFHREKRLKLMSLEV